MRGARHIFDVDVDLVQTSCGFGVPLFEYGEQLTLMDSWAAAKDEDGLCGVAAENGLYCVVRKRSSVVPRHVGVRFPRQGLTVGELEYPSGLGAELAGG